MKNPVKLIPDGYHSVTPYLVIKGAANAINFYKRAFGAEELFRMPGPDGKVMHAELVIGDSRIMLGEEPDQAGGTLSSIYLYVPDVDATFKQAVDAGAKQSMPVQNMFWGDRSGKLTDPFGQRWQLATHREDITPEQIQQRAAAAAVK